MGNSQSTQNEDVEIDVESSTMPMSAGDEKGCKEWVEKSVSLKIMATGKTGVGKSTLLNAIIGKKIFEEGDDLDPQTMKVEKHEWEKAGIKVTCYDTPGLLQNGSNEEEEYLANIKEECSDVHLLLYCISMMETRSDLNGDDEHSMAVMRITKTLGTEIWKHCVIALTFGNTYEGDLEDENKNVKKEFNKRVNEWKEHMKSALRKAGVEKAVVNKIVIVPTGAAKVMDLKAQKNWLSKIWSESLLKMKEEAQAAMVKIALHRFCEESDITAKDFGTDIANQPLVFTRTEKFVESGAAVAGAVTGAIIGGLLIGIPTCGMFIGLGMTIGSAAGRAAGTFEGYAVGLLMSLYRRRKKVKKIQKIADKLGKELAKSVPEVNEHSL